MLDYTEFRDRIVDTLNDHGLKGAVEEVIFLNSNSRGCEILVHPWSAPGDVWAKINFEWMGINQVFLEELTDDDPDDDHVTERLGDLDAEVMMHASFHLHFHYFSPSPDAVSDVAEEIKAQAESFFGDEGGVVAEVSMTSEEARLECLRFEVSTSAPLLTDEPWWDHLAEVTRLMLDKLQEILFRLTSEYGTSRDVLD